MRGGDSFGRLGDQTVRGERARLGEGLWNSIAGTLVVELLMFAVGVWLYARTTRARDRIGQCAFFACVALLLVLYIGDRFSAPPASVAEIAWPGIAAEVILLLWAWWFDRHRSLRTQVQTAFTQ